MTRLAFGHHHVCIPSSNPGRHLEALSAVHSTVAEQARAEVDTLQEIDDLVPFTGSAFGELS